MLARILAGKLSGVLLLAILSGVPALAGAASGEPDRVVGFSGNPASVTLYGDSQGSKVVGKVSVSQIRLPLNILRDEDEFVQVRIGNSNVWLDGALVTVQRGVEGDCNSPAMAGSKPVAVASTRGAAQHCR